jgi:very-short-patch-repair endonuclease
LANERARYLRRNRTDAEKRLWSQLRNLKQQGFKFRQQAPIDSFIVDFVCLSARLIVEVDGATHGTVEERQRDAQRQRYLEEQGLRVARFSNGDVTENLTGVMDQIVHLLEHPHPFPSPQGGGE